METHSKKHKPTPFGSKCSWCNIPIPTGDSTCYYHEDSPKKLKQKKLKMGFSKFGVSRDVKRLIWSKVIHSQSFDDTRDMLSSEHYLPDLVDVLKKDTAIWQKWWYEDFPDYSRDIGDQLPYWTRDSKNPWLKYYLMSRFLRVGTTKTFLHIIRNSIQYATTKQDYTIDRSTMSLIKNYGLFDLARSDCCRISGDIHDEYALNGTEKWLSITRSIVAPFYDGIVFRQCSVSRMWKLLAELNIFHPGNVTSKNSRYYTALGEEVGHSISTLWTFQSMLCWYMMSHYMQLPKSKSELEILEIRTYCLLQQIFNANGEFEHLLKSDSVPYISRDLC